MTRKHRGQTNRRKFLKATSGALAVTGLAGCSGGGGDSGSIQEDTTTTVGTTQTGAGDDDLSGTTIEYWSRSAAISEPAGNWTEQLIQQFEDETGINVELNIPPSPFGQPQAYQQVFQRGEYPVLFDMPPHDISLFMSEQWFQPLENWIDLLDEEIRAPFEWWMPKFETVFSGMEVTGSPHALAFPSFFQPFSTIAARRDHFEEAGLDPDSDFPPESLNEMISLAETLQADGPANFALGVMGESSDILDNGIRNWAASKGGDQGRIMNMDWTESYIDNDTWREATQEYVDLSQRDFASPESPSLSDEQVATQLGTGIISMSWMPPQRLPSAQQNAPDVYENNMMWGPHWSESGTQGHIAPYGFEITQKPRDVSESEWETQERAAARLIEFYLSEEVQDQAVENLAQLPVHENSLSRIEDNYADDHIYNVGRNMGANTDHLWAARHVIQWQYIDAPPVFQQAMTGDLSPEEATAEADSMLQDLLDGSGIGN